MTDPRLQRLVAATADAVRQDRERRAAVAAEAARPAAPGDLFLFPGPAANDLRWLVSHANADLPALYAVPVDGHPLVGLCDVPLPVPGDPMVARCGHGLWIARDEFRPEARVGVVPEPGLDRVRAKLAEMAAGAADGTAAQWEDEANPDYEDWLAEVERSVNALASALRVKDEVLTADQFTRPLAAALPGRTDEEAGAEYLVAAETDDPLTRLFAALRTTADKAPPARRVEFLYPGDLYLLREESGVGVVYLPYMAAPPPELHAADTTGAWQPATWRTSPAGTFHRADFGWTDEAVQLRFGRGDRARDVTVRR